MSWGNLLIHRFLLSPLVNLGLLELEAHKAFYERATTYLFTPISHGSLSPQNVPSACSSLCLEHSWRLVLAATYIFTRLFVIRPSDLNLDAASSRKPSQTSKIG